MDCPKCGFSNKPEATACANCYYELQSGKIPAGSPIQKQPSVNVAASSPAPSSQPESVTPPVYGAPSGLGFNSNTSGTGSTAVVPEEIKGWNWGAFLLTWIWAIFNHVWIGLLVFVPYAGFIVSIVLGLKGSEWAWQRRKWDSVEQFKETQRAWTKAGVILIAVVFGMAILTALLFPIFARARQAAMMHP